MAKLKKTKESYFGLPVYPGPAKKQLSENLVFISIFV